MNGKIRKATKLLGRPKLSLAPIKPELKSITKSLAKKFLHKALISETELIRRDRIYLHVRLMPGVSVRLRPMFGVGPVYEP
jgi:hypothetical protein